MNDRRAGAKPSSAARARPWDSVITDRDRAVLAASGMGQRGGIGSRPCLLVVDVTYAFTGDRAEPILESVKRFPNSCGDVAWESLPKIAELIAAMRSRSVPVIYTRQAPRDDALTAGAWARKNSRVLGTTDSGVDPMQIPDLIAPAPGDIVIDKDKPSAFFGTTLLSFLHALRIDSLVIAGTSTSGCVRSSGVDAFSYNYPTVVVEDCCFDRSLTSHAVALFDLHSRYADVMRVDELLQLLDEADEARAPATPAIR
jgi:nicotinamidase-related amidase